MSVEDITKWVTLTGAVLGGVTGVLTYWSKIGEKRDNIKVGFGSLRPPMAPGYCLYALSRSDHAMRLHDYGFVDMQGKLLSLPDLWANSFENNENDQLATAGSSTLAKRGDTWEVCYQELRDEQIGAYAITVGQSCRRVDFGYTIPMYRRLYLRWKIWRGPEWQ